MVIKMVECGYGLFLITSYQNYRNAQIVDVLSREILAL